jgi:hypothetical protein
MPSLNEVCKGVALGFCCAGAVVGAIATVQMTPLLFGATLVTAGIGGTASIGYYLTGGPNGQKDD